MKILAVSTGKLLIDTFAPVFGLLITMWLLWNVETRFFPVVNDFHVKTFVKLSANEYVVTGELNKSRSCELVSLSVTRRPPNEPTTIIAQYKKEIFGADAGTGRQNWGPVVLKFPSSIEPLEEIEVVALHRCHALWLQQSSYGKFLFGSIAIQ